MLLPLIDFTILAAIVWFAVSQIFYPIYRGTILFPLFRKETVLLGKLAEEKQTTVEKKIERDITKEKEKRK